MVIWGLRIARSSCCKGPSVPVQRSTATHTTHSDRSVNVCPSSRLEDDMAGLPRQPPSRWSRVSHERRHMHRAPLTVGLTVIVVLSKLSAADRAYCVTSWALHMSHYVLIRKTCG
ncbi:hypothetical protein FKP32DRAFT_1071991 [Trametes sanguinea]|nr:hypothetical protein FKP32DRAFT_1071991 [Trametes sanguinea]